MKQALVLAAMVAACSSGSSEATPASDADLVETVAVDAEEPIDTGAVDAFVPADAPVASTPCWPFERPAIASLRASKRKVFAHYFSAFPLSLDDKPAASDYYAVNYLRPEGEGGKFAYCGGFLKERPLPVEPGGAGYQERNYDLEVKRAVALGLDGFTYDILSNTGTHWDRLKMILDSAKRVDPGFRIVLMPDMTSTFKGADADAQTAFVAAMKEVASHPSTYHLDDGRLVISPFATDARTAAWWAASLAELKSAGIEVALVPLYVAPWEAATKALAATVPLYGTSTWGPRTVSGAMGLSGAAKKAHDLGLVWMAPVAPQDSRPKDLIFTEASNSRAFRALWDAAIGGGADWVQMITWNDYSEDSEISASSQIHGAFYDLTAYYTTWFKTGAQPVIARDTLYWFHRTQSMSAKPDLTKQKNAYVAVNGAAAVDEIEVVGFLTGPGTLEITVAGHTQTKDVGAGIQSFVVPLEEGTPSFRLTRGGVEIVSAKSASPISNTIVYQDPLYHAGGSLACSTD
ncbi:MAG: glycoside hydrolase family 71 protein [Polyangiales bacterium]